MKIFSLLDTQYNNFIEKAKNYLSKTLSNYDANYGNSTIFGQLINVLSGAIQNVMLYIEDAFVEQNVYTAQRKKSIYSLAALSGYQPSLGKAAGVQLKMSYVPTNEQSFNVVINNHEPLICTQNGMTYNIILPQNSMTLSIEKDNSAKFIYAVQGQFETQRFVSSGGKYWVQNVSYSGNIDVDYLEVYINGELWEKCDSIYDMVADGKQYTCRANYVGGLDVIFGNDIHGRQLVSGDVIEISYLVHDGESGNLDANTETYFVFNNMLKDINGTTIDGNAIFNVSFASKDPIISGSNSESKEQVRQNIGLNSRSLVLSSPNNYKNFLNKFSFCGYNRTWSEPGSMVINSIVMKNYKLQIGEGKDYFKLNEADFKLTDLQKNSITNALTQSGQQLAGVQYNIFDPEICKYALYLYIKLKANIYDQDNIRNQIKNLVGEFFSDVNSDIYIPKSDIINLLKSNIDGIDGVNAYFLSEKNETALQTNKYISTTKTYNPSKGTYDVESKEILLEPGENPNLGLDNHGNIYLESDEQFPVLMGGWDFLNKESQEVDIVDPLIIVFE